MRQCETGGSAKFRTTLCHWNLQQTQVVQPALQPASLPWNLPRSRMTQRQVNKRWAQWKWCVSCLGHSRMTGFIPPKYIQAYGTMNGKTVRPGKIQPNTCYVLRTHSTQITSNSISCIAVLATNGDIPNKKEVPVHWHSNLGVQEEIWMTTCRIFWEDPIISL